MSKSIKPTIMPESTLSDFRTDCGIFNNLDRAT